MAESSNAVVIFSAAKKVFVDEKISRKVSRRVVNPACMAFCTTGYSIYIPLRENP
jgi:hypothetical protein